MKKFLLAAFILIIFTYVPLAHAQEIQSPHTFYNNAYYYQKDKAWYTTTLEYYREEQNRVYFGGFVSTSSDENQVGKWISGSVPKSKVEVLKKNLEIPEVVY